MASQNMLVTFQLLFHSRKILAFPLDTKNNLTRMMHFYQKKKKKKTLLKEAILKKKKKKKNFFTRSMHSEGCLAKNASRALVPHSFTPPIFA